MTDQYPEPTQKSHAIFSGYLGTVAHVARGAANRVSEELTREGWKLVETLAERAVHAAFKMPELPDLDILENSDPLIPADHSADLDARTVPPPAASDYLKQFIESDYPADARKKLVVYDEEGSAAVARIYNSKDQLIIFEGMRHNDGQ